MIERLLAAEAALARGELDLAGRLFGQVAEADRRNAIAIVGLARIAQREGRIDEASELAERALVIDPDEAVASRLLRELLAASPAPAPASAPPALPATAPRPGASPSLFDRVRSWLAGLSRRR
jgi:tetratricopeptide (TPR) repeat protein